MSKKNTTALLKQLRSFMKNTSYVPQPLHAYIIPSVDSHQNEYIAPADQRRAFICGFTGSSGTAVVTEKHAAMWTDGRYYLQAEQEMDENWTLMKLGLPCTLSEGKWLIENLPVDSVIGIDPFLYDSTQWNDLSKEVKSAGHKLIPVTQNLVDLVWGDERPEQVRNIIFPLEVKFTGMNAGEKIRKVQKQLIEEHASCLIITAMDEIAYLYNLRGTDVEYNPIFFSYAAVTLDEAVLFVDETKLTAEAIKELANGECCVSIRPYDSLAKFIQDQVLLDSGKIWISNKSSYALSNLIPNNKKITKLSPLAVMKAIKNSTEIEGMESCHIRDAAALCRYLHWLEKEVPTNKHTEISGADQLQKFREEQDYFVSLSFPTISSVGPHAAINHYQPSPKTDRRLSTHEIYLVDSGGQYKDGTTDVTRTVHLGTPTDFEKECFTRVLKGFINLATCIFPDKLKGNRLDTLARKALWDVGLEYKHGTSHGVGMYLCVHEGPTGISWREQPNDPGLQEGMFLSDEPGYYEDGKFGIRIENIVRVVKAEPKYKKSETKFLTFKNTTYVPIQTKLINRSLLTETEITWLNDYHAACRAQVGKLLLEQGHKTDYEWLVKATEPLG